MYTLYLRGNGDDLVPTQYALHSVCSPCLELREGGGRGREEEGEGGGGRVSVC